MKDKDDTLTSENNEQIMFPRKLSSIQKHDSNHIKQRIVNRIQQNNL